MIPSFDFTTVLLALGLSQASTKPGPPQEPPPNTFLQTSSSPSCTPPSYNVPPVQTTVFPPFDRKRATIYRYRQQRSVNLGSWFVQENWMIPSLFSCASAPRASEHDVASGWDGNTASARQALERHWDTFIQDSDFSYLHSIGINTVRLPIGFWSLGPEYCVGTPFESVSEVYQNSWARVLRAISTADKYGIGVLVDLHGAPGSQNGQSHSGISDGKTGLFSNPYFMNRTIDVLTFLTDQLVYVNNVVGIQLLNEPNSADVLPDFYTRTLDILRSRSDEAKRFPFYIHDAFQLQKFSDYVSKRTDFLVEDHHSYFVYTSSDTAESASGHTHDVNSSISDSLASTANAQRRNLVVDEWSCALTAQSLSQERDPDEAQREFCTGQMNTYASTTAGWAFWSYYKEDCPTDGGWCFKQAVGSFLPSTFFSYPQPNSTDGGLSAPRDPLASLGDGLALALGNLTDAPIEEIVSLAFNRNITSPVVPIQQNTSFTLVGRGVSGRPHQRAIQQRQMDRRHHRYSNDQRRGNIFQPDGNGSNIDAVPSTSPDRFRSMSSQQVAISRGYEDGFKTAKVFAQFGMSKLGFTGQYVLDTFNKLVASGDVSAGQEKFYEEWFMKGLKDTEAAITTLLVKS